MKVLIIIGIIIVLIAIGILIYKKVDKDSKELEITKSIRAGIPFKLEYEIKDRDIVEFVKSYVVQDDNKGGIVGAKVYTNYVFKGLKKGETTITFKMVSITGEYESTNEGVYHVLVDDDLNISLVAINE